MMEKLRITVNGRSYDVTVEVLETDENKHSPKREPESFPVQPLTAINGGKAQANTSKGNTGSSPGNSAGKTINSPMPGTILSIKVNSGDQVKRGQVLIILEAMKMENEIMADSDGTIRDIHVSPGQSVQTGDLLITLT
ncbi:MAG TPA: biotin/lipoyl-binding protein [Bacillota bacterium]|jgi:biotin carboxyl carrier protein|nr:biotin/lipoyl-containing protein [Peptococcaceae bacterium MAG4]HPU35203.1 biotin/lipoyl-binding protein [Bacillota bacterium]